MTHSPPPPAGSTGQFDDDLDALAELLAAEGIEPGDSQHIPPRPTGAPAPMSFAQELLWMLDRAMPGMTAYNMPIARRLRGALDVAALERALTAVVARHEVLRSRLAEVDGEPRQIVDPPAPVTARLIDVSSTEDPETEMTSVVRERARTPFDLAHEHAFRISLVRLAPDDHVLVLETHHIVVDGWSLGLLYRELSAAYAAARAGRHAELPAPAIQYGDYAAWQRTHLTGARLEELLSFWRTQLDEATEPLDLPTDFRRAQSPTFAGARESILMSASNLASLKAFAQAHSATLYMTLLAAYATVLHRYTGRANVLIGSGSAGRTLRETESMVGYLNNTLVQRADFAGDPTFAELLGRVRASALGAYDHQEVPLEKLVLELRQGDARLSTAPLFDVVLTMQDTLPASLTLDEIDVLPFGADLGATKFDITLLPAERAGELYLTAQYRADLYAPETIGRFLGHLRAVLETAVARPEMRISEIPMLSADERSALDAWNDTAIAEGTERTLVELFEAQVARVPDRVAVVGPRQSATAPGSVAVTPTLTYAELNARANQLARHLLAAGAEPSTPVGLLLDGSIDAIVGMWGILKAGGAYVPLSIDAPAPRLKRQLVECGAKLAVSSAALADRLPDSVSVVALDRDASVLGALPNANLEPLAPPQGVAYVLYTSGSTGVPKGVAVSHANVVHYTRAVSRVLSDVPAAQPGDALAALDGWHFGLASTLAADLGNTSLFPALLAGATLHVLGKDVTTNPDRFAEYVGAHRVDVLKITPNHLAALVAGKTGAALTSLLPHRWVVLGGEALRLDTARMLLQAGGPRVLNHYGPTETTVGVLTHEITFASLAAAESLGAQTVPLGRPLSNTHAYVVDARGNEQPAGVPGELWLGGAGVTAGYLNRPELTAERFGAYKGERVYRTGDRVRRLSDGTLEFLGRTDDQVKVRGYRVELGEVEAALRAHPGVAQGVVVLREEELVAYAVPKQAGYAVSHNDRATSEKLTQWLAAQLPVYMVPSAVVLLEQLPLTANGKIDRTQLPAQDATGASAADAYVAPRTATETQLAAIWAEVLKREVIGVTDNFLALGGHSLLAIRVLGKISKAFGVRLPLRLLFDAPTVEQLAERIEAERSGAGAASPEKGLVSRSRDAYRVGRPTTSGSGSEPGA
jgi:amino acid adenylation domain-containing protein